MWFGGVELGVLDLSHARRRHKCKSGPDIIPGSVFVSALSFILMMQTDCILLNV